jgi:pimeloyl-ACP methyl ester carboxylesterase
MIAPLMTAVNARLSRQRAGDNTSRMVRGLMLLGGFSVLFYLAGRDMSRETGVALDSSLSQTPPGTVVVNPKSSKSSYSSTTADKLATGSTAQGVSYYHCAPPSSPPVKEIVLLHGAKFTKEDWKTSTILPQLCANGKVNVVALDLSIFADDGKLRRALQTLYIDQVLQKDGDYVLVTPSASGKAVVDWINRGDLAVLKQKIGLWVPIASPAIVQLDDETLHAIKSWPILALYGDQDARGKQLSQRLVQKAGAAVKEFPGGHPFYLDVPNEFTSFLLEQLGVL